MIKNEPVYVCNLCGKAGTAEEACGVKFRTDGLDLVPSEEEDETHICMQCAGCIHDALRKGRRRGDGQFIPPGPYDGAAGVQKGIALGAEKEAAEISAAIGERVGKQQMWLSVYRNAKAAGKWGAMQEAADELHRLGLDAHKWVEIEDRHKPDRQLGQDPDPL